MADWPLIGVRFALYLTLAALFGLAAFGLYGLRTGERIAAAPFRPWLVASAVSGFILSSAALALTASAMAGVPPWPLDWEAMDFFLDGSAIGAAWKWRIAALALAGVAALFVRRSERLLGVVMIASVVALSTLAWTGHGAADDGRVGWLHLVADLLHLLAAGLWVGALVALVLLVSRPIAQVDSDHLGLTHRALHGFGAVGTIVVGTIVVTGLINSWLLVGVANVAALGTTLYGLLLVAKLALFAAMLGLAALNRFRLTPAFETSIAANDHRGALMALRRSLALETACAVVILALVGWLGTLAPPASVM